MNNPIRFIDPDGMAVFHSKALGSHWADDLVQDHSYKELLQSNAANNNEPAENESSADEFSPQDGSQSEMNAGNGGGGDKKKKGSPAKGGRDVPNFYGVDIRYIPEFIPFSSFFAGAINTHKSTFDYFKKLGLNSESGRHLMHEYGHYLQNKYGGETWYFMAIVLTSVININTANEYVYNQTWTEVQANTMSYYFFNYPSKWDFTEYPIDHNSISDELKSILYYHIPNAISIKP